jgi:hypothetical protein
MRTVGKLEMALASILQVEPCRRNHFGCWTANLVGWSPENMRHALCDCHWLLEVLQTHNMQRCFSWFDITNTCLKNAWFNGLIDICMWGGCLTIWNQKNAYPPCNLPVLISYCVLHVFLFVFAFKNNQLICKRRSQTCAMNHSAFLRGEFTLQFPLLQFP